MASFEIASVALFSRLQVPQFKSRLASWHLNCVRWPVGLGWYCSSSTTMAPRWFMQSFRHHLWPLFLIVAYWDSILAAGCHKPRMAIDLKILKVLMELAIWTSADDSQTWPSHQLPPFGILDQKLIFISTRFDDHIYNSVQRLLVLASSSEQSGSKLNSHHFGHPKTMSCSGLNRFCWGQNCSQKHRCHHHLTFHLCSSTLSHRRAAAVCWWGFSQDRFLFRCFGS